MYRLSWCSAEDGAWTIVCGLYETRDDAEVAAVEWEGAMREEAAVAPAALNWLLNGRPRITEEEWIMGRREECFRVERAAARGEYPLMDVDDMELMAVVFWQAVLHGQWHVACWACSHGVHLTIDDWEMVQALAKMSQREASMRDALEVIATMQVLDHTDTAEALALCMSIARIELEKLKYDEEIEN